MLISAPVRLAMNEQDVAQALDALAEAVIAAHPRDAPLNVVGILTRGETLAARMRSKLKEKGLDVRRGVIDITLYRDDLSEIGPAPVVRPSDLPPEIDAVPMLLVDDVIYTGRSVRAALNVIADFGRPRYVRLAVLVDRGGRQVPVQPDHLARRIDLHTGRVNVRLTENDGRDAVEVEDA